MESPTVKGSLQLVVEERGSETVGRPHSTWCLSYFHLSFSGSAGSRLEGRLCGKGCGWLI